MLDTHENIFLKIYYVSICVHIHVIQRSEGGTGFLETPDTGDFCPLNLGPLKSSSSKCS